MIQTCNEEYWQGMETLKPEGAPCGVTFDDYDHLTICPHPYFADAKDVDRLRNECSKLGHKLIHLSGRRADGDLVNMCLCGDRIEDMRE